MSELVDLGAEAAVLGTLLALPDRIAEAALVLDVGDFYRPAHGAIFAALVDLHRTGHPVDDRAVLAECRKAGDPVDARLLVALPVGGQAGWKRNADTVVQFAARRRLELTGAEMMAGAADPTADPGDVVADTRRRLSAIATGRGEPPADVTTVAELARRPIERTPWVVPGLLRNGWRCIVVAPEGRGKTLLARQCAVAVSQGIHPLTFRPCEPKVSLLVDLENPEDNLVQWSRRLISAATGSDRTFDESAAIAWSRPAGIDLRQRAHRNELDAILGTYKPDLVCLGPLYKAYQRQPRENDEDATLAVQAVLDDLRTRHGCALLLEHHAPHDASNGLSSNRKMRPFGSSVWLRWPEFGLGLDVDPDRPGSLLVKRWRGDRVEGDWPQRLDRGSEWPWVGWWRDGTPSQPELAGVA